MGERFDDLRKDLKGEINERRKKHDRLWACPAHEKAGEGAIRFMMLSELEFAYTPVRDKVADLREYL